MRRVPGLAAAAVAAGGLACGTTLAVAAASSASAPPSPAAVKVIAVDGLSCRSGKYAVLLPRHYPTLHAIGRHRTSDVAVRQRGAVRITTRRIEYFGLRLEVLVFSDDPSRYELLLLESSSRRWNIGRLSVGASPWRWGAEKGLERIALDGAFELTGAQDSVRLQLSDGRVDRVAYHCRPADAG